MIINKFSLPYYEESRVRAKLTRWGFSGIAAHLARRVSVAFDVLKIWCNPRVQTTYFRTIWNGWVTDRRLNTLVRNGRSCVLGCGWEEDSIEHYSCCSVFWGFVHLQRPEGLGVPSTFRSREALFLLTPGLTEQDKVRLALGLHGLYNLVNRLRWHPDHSSFNHRAALKLLVRRAAERSRAYILLAA
jgi:hypothetical protein